MKIHITALNWNLEHESTSLTFLFRDGFIDYETMKIGLDAITTLKIIHEKIPIRAKKGNTEIVDEWTL